VYNGIKSEKIYQEIPGL